MDTILLLCYIVNKEVIEYSCIPLKVRAIFQKRYLTIHILESESYKKKKEIEAGVGDICQLTSTG